MAAQKGRPRILGEREIVLLKSLYFKEGMSVRQVAAVLRVSHMTVWRVLCHLSLPRHAGKICPNDERKAGVAGASQGKEAVAIAQACSCQASAGQTAWQQKTENTQVKKAGGN
ncbi:MAG: helix-turn-helix domain-containing protein [Candidatus Micrarchaeota archaeon]|nr:helix-turn-helix domain-containing protein [Candidatus Micrarchaeota archaeon]